jgi:hypothetical protein
MPKYVSKLGSDKSYKRPKVTYQEKLTAKEIAEKLQGYQKVDNIADVPINTHVRYFIQKSDGSRLFRTGGFLNNKQNADKYVILSNGKHVWSVQVKNTIFFRKLSHKEEIDALHRYYKNKLKDKDKIIKKLEMKIKMIKESLSSKNEKNNKKVIESKVDNTKNMINKNKQNNKKRHDIKYIKTKGMGMINKTEKNE